MKNMFKFYIEEKIENPHRVNDGSIIKTTHVINGYVTFSVFLLIIIMGAMWGCPNYNVWRSEMVGKAEFMKAEQNRKIKVEEAKANLEAEKLNADAEIERAKGAASAIEIEGGKLTPTYIQYLWVRQNQFNDKTVIYIPTETNLPILEANRYGK